MGTLLLIAGLEGVLSFLSPCILLLMPVYLSVLNGDVRDKDALRTRLLSAMFFVVGFATVFVAIGASTIESEDVLRENFSIVSLFGGAGLLLLGLQVIGIFRIPLKLPKTSQFSGIADRMPIRAGLAGAFFALGWLPCSEPVLSAIRAVAESTNSVTQGMLLMLTYSLGIGFPLLAIAMFYKGFLRRSLKVRGGSIHTEKLIGMFIIGVSVLVMTGRISLITRIGGRAEAIEKRITTAFAEASRQAPGETESRIAPASHPLAQISFPLIDGRRLTYADLKGKYVLINFWAPWCPPCRTEISDFIEIYKDWHSRGLEIIGIAEDSARDDTENYVKTVRIPYYVVFQQEREWAEALGISQAGLPRSLLYAPDGRILIKRLGVLEPEALVSALAPAGKNS
ncbi:MAG: redoxin domain-containing protein [bacterium JZ-2024 1]